MQQGNEKFEAKAYKEALALYLRALYRLRQDPDLAYAIAATYYAMDQHFQAIRHYQRAFRLRPPNRTQLEEYGQSHLDLRLLSRALTVFRHCTHRYTLYPRCYYHKLHTASLLNRRRKALLGMYRDQYNIVTQRTHVQRRGWDMQRFMAWMYKGDRSPTIAHSPAALGLTQHFAWFRFLLRMFPKDKDEVLEESTRLLMQFAKAHPSRKQDAVAFHGLFQIKAGHTSQGRARLKRQRAQRRGAQRKAISTLLAGLRLEAKGRWRQAWRRYASFASRTKPTPRLMRAYLDSFPGPLVPSSPTAPKTTK
ncbi:MAG: hypothetical protein KDB61_14945, partial [Planctomycetes bacterium]|nr:hypothetical protein [Planctomycetota bacterium]